jgi:hypothetical protein
MELKGIATAGAGPVDAVAGVGYAIAGPTATVRLAGAEPTRGYAGASAANLETVGSES